MVTVIFIISIAILAILTRIHKKNNKKAKEELAGQRQIQYEAEHKRKLVEQATHAVYLVIF